VLLKVQVPKADARLWVEGQEMQRESGQEQRTFLSPPLESGKQYEYTVRASWMENGQEVSRERKVPAQPGQQVAVFFREGEDSGTTAEPGRNLRPNDSSTRPGTPPNQPSNPSEDASGPRPSGNPSNRPPL
jgi:uncharacterized protein (TIGR03000 family)